MGGEKIVEMGAGLSIGLQSLNRKARNLRQGQEIEPKTSKRELLWAKAKEEDTAAWQDPVRGHHLERISSSIQRFFSYTYHLFELYHAQETILYCAPPELEVKLVRMMFATSVFYNFTHVF